MWDSIKKMFIIIYTHRFKYLSNTYNIDIRKIKFDFYILTLIQVAQIFK